MEAEPTSQIPLENKILDILEREFQEMKKKVSDLENKSILESLQIPKEDLKDMGLLKDDPIRITKGRDSRPLLELEIKEAQEHCNNATACARYLNVGYVCYKKWAKIHSLFKINPWGKGDKKSYWDPDKGKYSLNQTLECKFPDYPVYRLKDKLIKSGTKKAKCENCGFDEHRITDQKMPLLISFIDGNERNHLLSNIEILCYNCMFLTGRGYIRRGKVEFNFLN